MQDSRTGRTVPAFAAGEVLPASLEAQAVPVNASGAPAQTGIRLAKRAQTRHKETASGNRGFVAPAPGQRSGA